MRKLGACVAAASFAAIVAAPLPAAAFGFHIGPFHVGLPFFWHRHHRHLYMHSSIPARGEVARAEQGRGDLSPQRQSVSDALLYPSLALPAIYQNIFWPAPMPWPFGYQAIFTTAFAKAPPAQDPQRCQQPFDANAIVGRVGAEISPTPNQTQILQKLGGALNAAAGALAKSCPADIPAQPTARLQMMQSQLEQLTMTLGMIHQPLQDLENSLSRAQQARYVSGSAPAATPGRQAPPNNVAAGCGGAADAINWSLDQIYQSVQPTDAQRDSFGEVKQAFGKAASDLEAHCPATVPPTPLGRLETIEARLDSTWRAVLSIQVALANFESKLDATQKERFEATDFAAR